MSTEIGKKSYTHNIPIHLETKNHLVLGLTARQVLVIGAGLTMSYMVNSSLNLGSSTFGLIVLLLLSAIPAGIGFLVAFVSPNKRGLEEWALVCLLYATMPKTYLWRPLMEKVPEQNKKQRVVKDEQDEED